MEETEHKTLERYTQETVAYTPISLNAGAACASCRWFIGSASGGPACHVVENYPLDIEPTGWCSKHESVESAMAENEVPTVTEELVQAIQEMAHDDAHDHDAPDEMDSLYIAPHDGGILKTLASRIAKGLKPGASIIKANGRRYMLIVTSNSYKDRDAETITTQALKEYVDKSWIAEDLFHSNNPLLFWHDDRLDIGQIVWADMHGPFLVELAQEGGTPIAKALFDYRESHPDEKWGASHRFAYFKKDRAADGTYRRIYKQETSVLPREAAANLLTFSGVLPMTDKRGETLNKMLGLDNAAELLDKGIGELVAELNKRNIEHKSASGASAKPNDAETVADVEKTFGALLSSLIDSQAELVERQDALESGYAEKGKSQDEAAKSVADQLKALTETVQQLSTQMDQRPRSATRAVETELEDKELTDDLRNLNTHVDPIWGRVKDT